MRAFLLTSLLLVAAPAEAQTIPQHQRNAMFGARGQIPSGSNPYVCDKDFRVDPSGAGTVTVKWDGNSIGQPLILNFTGNVDISMTGATANIRIPGSGNSIPLAGYDQAIGGYQHLVVSCTTNSTVTIKADLLDVQGNFTAKCLSSVDLTAVITTSGSGGLASGTVEPNTWYRLWVGAKLDGSEPAAYFTRCGPYYQDYVAGGPPSPSSHKLWRQVDWVLTDASSNIKKFLTVGRRHIFSYGPYGAPILGYSYSGSFHQEMAWFAPPAPAGRFYAVIASARYFGDGRECVAKFRTHGYSAMSVTAMKSTFSGNGPYFPLELPISTDRSFDASWPGPTLPGEQLYLLGQVFSVDTML